MAVLYPTLTFDWESIENRLRLVVRGEITLGTGGVLREAVLQKLNQKPDEPEIVFDLTDVNFVDTTGIGILIGLKSSCSARKKRMVLKDLQPPVLEAFAMMRLHQVFPLELTGRFAYAF